MNTVDVGGIPMRWEESGEGPPVVLIHGLPTGPSLWRGVVPLLDGVRALSWEMVGYASSWAAGENRDISLRAQASYLVSWLEALDIDSALLAGHDLGGGVAQIAAVGHAERCAGIVLADAVCYDAWPIPIVRALRAMRGLTPRSPRPLRKALFGAILRRGHSDRAVAAESIRLHWLHYDHDKGAPALNRQMLALRAQDTLDIVPGLSSLGVPAAVVWGVSDPWLKIDLGRRLASDLGADLDEVHGAKHFVPEDQPGCVAAAITAVAPRAFG